MPGYGAKMERFTPEPTEETPKLEKRFVTPSLPALTFVQWSIVVLVLVYAWSVRKMNKAVIPTAALAIGLLHMYDHLTAFNVVANTSSSSQRKRRKVTAACARNKLVVNCKYARQNCS